jgi:hypothetical protein
MSGSDISIGTVTCGPLDSVPIRRVPTRNTHRWTHNQPSQWTMGFERPGTSVLVPDSIGLDAALRLIA